MPENTDKSKEVSFLKKLTEAVEGFFGNHKEIFKTVKLKDGKEIKYQFMDVMLKDGTKVSYDGETPMEGMPIYVIPSDGSEPIAPADGVLVFEDGTEVEVKGGVIMTVKLPAGAPPPPTGEMGTLPATEAAAKKIIESTIRETVFSKQEVSALLEKQKTEFEAIVKSVSEKFDAVKAENENLTKELGKISANHEMLIADTTKLTAFSKQLPELLKEFGAAPQTEETEEEKQKRLNAFNTEKREKITMQEWRKLYMK